MDTNGKLPKPRALPSNTARIEKNLQRPDVKNIRMDIKTLDATLEEVLRESKAVWAHGVL
jgi:hypothetical protein